LHGKRYIHTYCKVPKQKVFLLNHPIPKLILTLRILWLNKSTSTIQSGIATLTISGSVPNKGDFSYTGSITFNGDNMATLVIKDKTYTVNLKTGDYTAN